MQSYILSRPQIGNFYLASATPTVALCLAESIWYITWCLFLSVRHMTDVTCSVIDSLIRKGPDLCRQWCDTEQWSRSGGRLRVLATWLQLALKPKWPEGTCWGLHSFRDCGLRTAGWLSSPLLQDWETSLRYFINWRTQVFCLLLSQS